MFGVAILIAIIVVVVYFLVRCKQAGAGQQEENLVFSDLDDTDKKDNFNFSTTTFTNDYAETEICDDKVDLIRTTI